VLAKGITIKADKPTNSVFIRHYEADLERIKKLIREKLDVPLPQVKIEARLNDLNRADLLAVGVRWGGAAERSDGRNILLGQGFATQNTGGIAPTLFGSSGRTSSNPNLNLSGFLPVSAATGLPTGGNIVNLPTGETNAGAIAFGIIGTKLNLNLILEALEKQTKSRSLSKPEIVTVENAKATISLGSEIPYSTVSSAGTQVQFKDAVLKLEVTPTVIREPEATKIKMKIVIENNKKGDDVPSGVSGGTIPTINKQKAETEVIVKEGETLVIGGISQRTEAETIRKVPLFGDIPLIGWLFKARRVEVDPNRELVVFITPTVLKTDQQSKPVSLK
jgi:type IV pilus assembly protein PilQ